MRTVLSISLPEKIGKELDIFAKNTGRNKNDIVKESLSLFLWKMKLMGVQGSPVTDDQPSNYLND
jgi:predicted DNA-binding protein